MILQLALTHLKNQRRSVIWATVLLAFALACTAGTLFLNDTQSDLDRLTARLGAHGKETTAVIANGEPGDWFVESYYRSSVGQTPLSMSLEESTAVIDEAIAGGSDIVALRWPPNNFTYQMSSGETMHMNSTGIVAVKGDYPWGEVLIEGNPPRPGEIVINAKIAQRERLSIGDPFTVGADQFDGSPASEMMETFTISGISRMGFEAPSGQWTISYEAIDAYVAWEETEDHIGPWAGETDDWNHTYAGPLTFASWDTGHPALDAFDQGLTNRPLTYNDFILSSFPWLLGLAVLAGIGVLVTAMSLGRVQAQERLQWVATARTLGVTQRGLAVAVLMETALVSAFSAAIGLLVGWGIAKASVAEIDADPSISLAPGSATISGGSIAIVAGLGFVAAALLSAVPAFWAIRTAPVAALKPVTPLDDDSKARRLPARWLGLGLILSLAIIWIRAQIDAWWIGTIGWIALAASVALILREILRKAVVTVGTRLSKGSTPWAVAAGGSLIARPRQGIVPAIMLGLLMLLMSVGWGISNLDEVEILAALGPNESFAGVVMWKEAVMTLVIIFIAIQVMGLGNAFAGQRAAARESATRMALGLSQDDAQRAAFVQYLTPQALAVAMTALTGFVVAFPVHFGFALMGDGVAGSVTDYLAATGLTLVIILSVAACSLVSSVLGGLIVAVTTRPQTPVEALRVGS